MHALNLITTIMGRCTKTSKIYCDIRLSCSQLIQQGFETCTGRNEDKGVTRFKRCARSEPALNGDTHRLSHSHPYFQKVRGLRRGDGSKEREKKEAPMNHYTINIYLNSAPNDQVLYANNKTSHPEFSVDKLAKNIANGSPIIEGFLRNKDPEKDRDYIEEKLSHFWRSVFENSKAVEDVVGGKCEFDETPLEKCEENLKPQNEEPETKKSEDVKNPPYFLYEDQNERIYINKDFSTVENNEINNQSNEIPYYEKGFYNSRIVTPKKIVSSGNQVRTRFSQDTEEVRKHIDNLVKLSTKNQTKSSRFAKIIAYCKNFLTKEKVEGIPEKASSEEAKESFLSNMGQGGLHQIKRRCHNAAYGSTFKRHYSSRKSQQNNTQKKGKNIYRDIENSRHCLAGASTEKENAINPKPKAVRPAVTYKTNLAKNASKFALFNAILNITNAGNTQQEKSNPFNSIAMKFSKTRSNYNKPKTYLEGNLSQSKNATTFRRRFEPKRVKFEEKSTQRYNTKILRKSKRKNKTDGENDYTPNKNNPRIVAGREYLKNNKSLKFNWNPKRTNIAVSKSPQSYDPKQKYKVLKTPQSGSTNQSSGVSYSCNHRSEKIVKPISTYSTTFRRVSTQKPELKADPRLQVSNIFKHPESISFITGRKRKPDPGFTLHKKPFFVKPKKHVGVTKRTMSTTNDSPCNRKPKRASSGSRCLKSKKHVTKKDCVPTYKKLAKRDSEAPKEPLQYDNLHARCEGQDKAVGKDDLTKDIGGLFDASKQSDFKAYFGDGGYKNKEYYSYTKTSFYDLNSHVAPSRNPPAKSGAKPK